MEFLTVLVELGVVTATALIPLAIIGALTLGATEVLKIVFKKVRTQPLSIWVAIVLAFATGTSMLTPLGFIPANNFVDVFPWLLWVFKGAFYLCDLGLVGLLSSRVSNKVFDYLVSKNIPAAPGEAINS